MRKKILYFDELKFQSESLSLLKTKFSLLKPKNLKKSQYEKIISMIIPMNNSYNESFFSKFQNLRSILSPTTGDIHVDLDYLKKKKIKFINLRDQKKNLNNVTTTAELTIGHILNLTRKIILIHQNFIKTKKFDKHNYLLSNKMLTLGIIGLGRIGIHVANRAKALGFKVIYFDPYVNNKSFKKIKNFKDFIKKTNILSIHMHYKRKYFNMVNRNIMKLLKKPSYIINTSRGEFINETDLINSLKKKIINGAGLDVIKDEFREEVRKNPKKNKLFNFFLKNTNYNIFITPKQGGSNKNAWALTEKLIINKLIQYEKNKI